MSGIDQAALRANCREVLLKPSESTRRRRTAESEVGHDDQLWRLVSDLGWPALAVPQAWDGLAGTASDLGVVAEELGRALLSGPLLPTLTGTHVLGRYADDELRAELLPAVAGGATTLSWATRQPGPRPASEGLSVSGRAAPLHVDGRLPFVPHGDAVDWLLLEVEHGGLPALALIERASNGVSTRTQQTLDLTRRYVTVACTDVTVRHLIPAPTAIADLVELGVALQCAESVGIGSRVLEMTIDYAQVRTQFDRPIGAFQAIKHRIADMLMLRESARIATRDAERALEGPAAAALAVSVAKTLAGAGISRLVSESIQVHGGIGFTWEHDLHLFLRRAKVNELLLGTSAWHSERITELLSTPEN